jgi:hypothetical protein
VYELGIESLIGRILFSFQGDDEASGGSPPQPEDTDQEGDEDLNMNEDEMDGSGLRYVSAAELAQEPDWSNLRS